LSKLQVRITSISCLTNLLTGGKLTAHYIKKRPGVRKAGLPRLSTPGFSRLTSGHRTVARAYGGVLGHDEVRDRYLFSIFF
jgi:ribosomal protein L34E